jgi:CubicO group peptidase (beta-lactamase class C family)
LLKIKFTYMKQKFLLAFTFCCTLLFATAQFDASELDALLEKNKKNLGADVVTLVYKDGKVVYKKKLGDFFDEKTQVPIASASRWLTAALVLQFIDEGKLSLETPIADYLPIYATYGKKYITIRHCLTDLIGIESKKWSISESGKFETLEAMVDDYAKREIKANTGTDFWYSNMGINIAARVIEKITKKGFEQIMSQKLLRPLNMKNTSFSSNDGRAVNPASGAASTANDYMNFLVMLLNKGVHNGKQILSAKSVEELLAIQVKDIPISYAPKEAAGFDFGLGGTILEKDADGKTVAAGCTNFLGFWPFINVCNGYACIILPKGFLSDAKKELFSSVRGIIESQFASTCK